MYYTSITLRRRPGDFNGCGGHLTDNQISRSTGCTNYTEREKIILQEELVVPVTLKFISPSGSRCSLVAALPSTFTVCLPAAAAGSATSSEITLEPASQL